MCCNRHPARHRPARRATYNSYPRQASFLHPAFAICQSRRTPTRCCTRAMISQRPEDVFICLLRSFYHNAQHSTLRLIARRRPTLLSTPSSSVRPLNTSSHSGTRHSGTRPRPWIGIGRGAVYEGSRVASTARKQPYATTKTDSTSPREIAVLGAGITGLTAAHYLARHAENAHITIYEASDSPGGWIKADRVEVQNSEGRKGHVLLQSGPRMLRSSNKSLRYDDLVLFDVVSRATSCCQSGEGAQQFLLTTLTSRL